MPSRKRLSTLTILAICTLFYIAGCNEATANQGGDENKAKATKKRRKIYHDFESFLEVYNHPKSTQKDILFIKKTFPNQDAHLDYVEYSEFLVKYLENFIDNLPEGDKDIQAEAQEHHKEQVRDYMEMNGAKEYYGMDEVFHDIGLGNFVVFVQNNLIEPFDAHSEEQLVDYLKEQGIDIGDL